MFYSLNNLCAKRRLAAAPVLLVSLFSLSLSPITRADDDSRVLPTATVIQLKDSTLVEHDGDVVASTNATGTSMVFGEHLESALPGYEDTKTSPALQSGKGSQVLQNNQARFDEPVYLRFRVSPLDPSMDLVESCQISYGVHLDPLPNGNDGCVPVDPKFRTGYPHAIIEAAIGAMGGRPGLMKTALAAGVQGAELGAGAASPIGSAITYLPHAFASLFKHSRKAQQLDDLARNDAAAEWGLAHNRSLKKVLKLTADSKSGDDFQTLSIGRIQIALEKHINDALVKAGAATQAAAAALVAPASQNEGSALVDNTPAGSQDKGVSLPVSPGNDSIIVGGALVNPRGQQSQQ